MYLFIYEDGTSWYSVKSPTSGDLKLIHKGQLKCFCSRGGRLVSVGAIVRNGLVEPVLSPVSPGVIVREESGDYTVSDGCADIIIMRGDGVVLQEVGINDSVGFLKYGEKDLNALVEKITSSLDKPSK